MWEKVVTLLLLVIFCADGQCGEKLDIDACFDFPADRKVSASGRLKALAYLRSLTAEKEAVRAIELVCPQKLLHRASALKKVSQKLKIDGMDDDWAAVPVAAEDARDNVNVFDAKKTAGVASPEIDLSEVSYVCTENDLYLRFRTYAKPRLEDAYYSLQVYRDGELVGSIVLEAGQAFAQTFKNGQFEKVAPVPKDRFEMAIKDVVEARVDRSALPNLPPIFTAEGVSFSAKQNRVNFTKRFKIKPVQLAAATTSAYLLARYAEQTDLAKSGLVPLAVCLSEQVVYENLDAAVRERCIQDGVAMIAASRDVADQLAGLPFEALLAWSNRMLLWGG
ncbi:MAG: hypothetical protein JWM11_5059, partial [Planctomycetaceae bacterium]|nr:hypothetical protein [Planctomycetaceae bacterium]